MNIDRMIERVMRGENPHRVVETVTGPYQSDKETGYYIPSPVVEPTPESLHSKFFNHPEYEVSHDDPYFRVKNREEVGRRSFGRGEVTVRLDKSKWSRTMGHDLGKVDISWSMHGASPITHTQNFIGLLQHSLDLAKVLADKHGLSHDN